MSSRAEQAVTAPTDYLTPLPGGRVFTALDHARAADLAPGDVVLLRDVAALCPELARSSQRARGKWRIRPYRLADGQSGNLLMVCDFAGDQGPAAVPEEDPDLPFPADCTGMHDPYPGDEFIEQQEFDRQFGLGVDPTDYDRGFALRYAQGVDGVCLTNGPLWRAVGRLGHVEEVAQRAVTGAIWGQVPGPGMRVMGGSCPGTA